MIRLEPGVILVLFVAVPLAITAVLALFYSVRALHRPLRSQESIYKCVHCGHVYVIARSRPMDRCPRCGTLNEAVRS